MGGKAKSFEDEALDALNSAGDDEALAAEAGDVLRPSGASAAKGAAVFSEPDPGGEQAQSVDNMMARDPEYVRMLDAQLSSPAQSQMDEYLHRVATDPMFALEQLTKTGTNYLTGAVGAMGPELTSGANVIKNAALQGGAAAANRFANDKLDDVGTLEALLNAGKDGLYAGGAALGLGALGRGAQAGSDRARVAAFSADKNDLQAMGETPRSFAERTDELGLNNAAIPMDAADKRARIQEVLADRGAKHAEAIAAADAANPLEGRNVNREIAQDVNLNADRVMKGRSGERAGIQAAMGRVADAVEQGDPIDTLSELANYRTQQGGRAFGKFGSLPEEAAGKAALAGYDSADQKLLEEMRLSGDQNFRNFTAADADFHDLKLLEELTQQAPPSNPWRRAIGAGVGAAIGGVVGGGYPGMAIGAGVADMTRGYQADAMANLGQGMANNLGAASTLTGAATSMAEQSRQVQGQSRGQEQPTIVESLLDQNSPVLAPWAQQLQQARQDGTLNQKLTQLRNTDRRWSQMVLPQLQQLSAAQ